MAGLRRVLALSLILAGVAAAPATAGPNFFVGVDGGPASFVSQRASVTDLGVGAVRVPLDWSPGQAAPSTEQIAVVQDVVRTHPSLRVVVVAASSGDNAPTTELAREQYCSFNRRLLERFPSINDVLIWNEPNLSAFWKPQFNVDKTSAAPAAYLELLARCWDVLHAYRPGVNVLGPATSPRGNDNPDAVSNISHSPLAFIRKLGEAYRASGRNRRVLDTVAHHVYGSTPAERPWRVHTGSQISEGDWTKLMQAYTEAFQGTQQAIPGECVPGGCVWIWYTEGGYQTTVDEHKLGAYTEAENVARVVPDYVGSEPEFPPPAATSFAPDQWTQIIDGVRLAACQPYVRAFFNYLLVDDADLRAWQSGFLWADGTRKDSYPAFRQVIAEASGRRVDCSALKGGPPPQLDTTPPGAPPALRATRGDARVSLAWGAGSEVDVMGYNVYRASAGRPYEQVNGSVVASREHVDTGLANDVEYWYAVTAVDTAENEGQASSEVCVPRAGATACRGERPATSPSVALTAPPAGAVVRGDVALSADAADDIGVARVDFAVAGAVVASDSTAPYTATWRSASVADGPTTVEARAFDAGGNAAVSSRTVTVANLPIVRIASGPGAFVASSEVTFEFTVDEPVAGFECSLDGGPFLACGTPARYAGLADGAHAFRVRATDAVGARGVATTQTWTVDTRPPDTTIASGPVGRTTSRAATFTFGADEDEARFECALDGAAYAACVSPKSYTGLAAGAHAFRVRAVDRAGTRDASPAVRTWTVDAASAARIRGTPGPDLLVGTPGNDTIYAFGGNDVVRGRGGNDVLVGGPGNDRLEGGPGRDRLRGDGGRDRLFGNGGSDFLAARDGRRDALDGGRGRDEGRVDRGLDRLRSLERRRA